MLDDADRATYDAIVAGVRDGSITVPDETAGDPTVGAEGAGTSIDPASIGCTS